MQGLREELDPEMVPPRFANAPSPQHPHPVTCSTCGMIVFADEGSYESYLRSLQYDPANQFICDDCIDVSNDAAFLAG